MRSNTYLISLKWPCESLIRALKSESRANLIREEDGNQSESVASVAVYYKDFSCRARA